MLRLLVFLVSLGAYAIRALFLSRADLLTENLALRQQLAALKRQRPRPPLDDVDRAFWVALRAVSLYAAPTGRTGQVETVDCVLA